MKNASGSGSGHILVLLPYVMLSLGISFYINLHLGRTGFALACGIFLLFILSFFGLLFMTVILLALLSLFAGGSNRQISPSRFFGRLVCFCTELVLAFSGIRLHVQGLEKIPAGRFLLIQNHRSGYDPIVTAWALRDIELAFIAKPQILQLPVVGPILRRAGTLPIDRDNDREAIRTIRLAANIIKNDLASICIYPEGTRTAGHQLRPFRNGAFKIAKMADVPIVITSIRGTDEIKKSFFLKKTDVYLDILSVLDADSVRKMKTCEIGRETCEIIQNNLNVCFLESGKDAFG